MEEFTGERIGERIKEIRTENDLTQNDFAKKIKTYPHEISNIETGKTPVSLKTIIKIANAFPDVSLEYIIRGKKNKEETLIKEQKIQDLNTLRNIIQNIDQNYVLLVDENIKSLLRTMVKLIFNKNNNETQNYLRDKMDIIYEIQGRL